MQANRPLAVVGAVSHGGHDPPDLGGATRSTPAICRSPPGRPPRRRRISDRTISTRCASDSPATGGSDPRARVTDYRDDLRRADAYDAGRRPPLVATQPGVHHRRTRHRTRPSGSANCSIRTAATLTASEPCHAVVVRRRRWGDGYDGHRGVRRPASARHRNASPRQRQRPRRRPTPAPTGAGDDSHAKRKARLARLAHATETFAKTRGGFSQTDLTRARAASARPRSRTRCARLRCDDPRPRPAPRRHRRPTARRRRQPRRADHESPGAVALGLAETRMYWSRRASQCRDYLDTCSPTGLDTRRLDRQCSTGTRRPRSRRRRRRDQTTGAARRSDRRAGRAGRIDSGRDVSGSNSGTSLC